MRAFVDVLCPTLRAGGNKTGGDRPPGTDVDTCESLVVLLHSGGGNSDEIDVATTLNARGAVGRMDFESETFVTHARSGEGFDASEDGSGRGTPVAPVVVAFSCKDHGSDATSLQRCGAMPHDGSHANAGGHLAVAFNARQDPNISGSVSHPLDTDGRTNAICFNLRGREDGSQPEVADVASIRSSQGGSSRSYVAAMAVRRLTVVECARLQGFEDLYAHIEYGRPRKIDADEAEYLMGHGLRCWQDGEQWLTNIAADGNMYKAYGNSFAVPVVRWIGERIEAADRAKRGDAGGVQNNHVCEENHCGPI